MKLLLIMYTYIIQETGNESTQTYHVKVVILIEHQILVANLLGKVSQLERRINNHFLGVKGLIGLSARLMM